MSKRTLKPPRLVNIAELPEFTQGCINLQIDKNTVRGLYLVLAENPLLGVPVRGYPGLIELPFAGFRLLYVVGGNFSNIYLLCLLEKGDVIPAPSSEDGKAITRLVRTLAKGGLLILVREGLEVLWEFLRDWF